jgi:hypothetical protein
LSRYRLRFHLQEIDLARGITLIGRSEDCEVTIEDPLVSRRHARVVVDGDDVILEDLGSRNGVRLNGKGVRGSAKLKDGDRVRIGTQEFVFTRVVTQQAPRRAKTTGVLRLCAQCKLPYAREMISCPNCGATEQMDEETLSGTFGASSQHSWSVQLLIEALEKAHSLGRTADADRILRRATTLLEERVATGGALHVEQVQSLALAAARLCQVARDGTWGSWVAGFYARAALHPPANVSDALGQLAGRFPEIRETIAVLVDRCRSLDGSPAPEDADALARLAYLPHGVTIGGDDDSSSPDKPTAIPPKLN